MTDKETIINTFINNFVQKDKRERCYLELINPKKRNRFVDRLNHDWGTVLNMKYLDRIDKQNDTSEGIRQLLNFKNDELCYVISCYGEYDDKLLPFAEVFEKVYTKGLASLLINTSANALFLDTEHVQGPAPRFIGKRQSILI